MAYTNKISAIATTMLFLAVLVGPRWSEAQTMPTLNPLCILVTDIVQNCYFSGDLTPSEECCNGLKSATKIQVNCICDNIVENPSQNNLTQALFEIVHNTCGVADKFACKDSNGGATNKIAASMGLFGLLASLLF
ncbi:unnamed protein product [Cochlearia groenlandica]